MDILADIDFEKMMTAMVLGLVLLVPAQFLWRKFTEYQHKLYEEKKKTILVQKLTANFPKFASEFTFQNAEGIILGDERRNVDMEKPIREHRKDRKKNRDSEGNYVFFDYDGWPRSSYFAHVLSKEFSDLLDADTTSWKLFTISLWNSAREAGVGAKGRYWLDENGEIKDSDDDEPPEGTIIP